MKKQLTAKKRLKKKGQWLIEHYTSHQLLCCIDSLMLRNPLLHQSPNREAYDIAAQAYFDQWEENKQKEFDEFKNIDPLEKTNYKWH